MHPDHRAATAAAIFTQAVQHFGSRDWAQAESLCRQVLAIVPRHADALHMLGLACGELGRDDDAIQSLKEALGVNANDAAVWTNLGRVFYKKSQFAEAAECQMRAIALRENFAEAHYSLALASYRLGRFEQAIAAARRTTQLRPGYAEAHFNLGNLMREAGQLSTAVTAYQAALRLRPQWCDAHINIAATWQQSGEPERALEHYREVLRLEPGRTDIELSIGHALKALGRLDEAKAAYQRATARQGTANVNDPMGTLLTETLAEPIASDHQAISRYHERVKAGLDAFAVDRGKLDLATLHTHAAKPSSMLAYQVNDLRPLMERYAEVISPLIPRRALRPRHGKPKLGIVVTSQHESAFARMWGGIIERLSRERFEVRLACSRDCATLLRSTLSLPEYEYVYLPARVDEAAKVLHEQEFDWLHYWEINTDATNYYLPFFHAAPGQSTGWGWPVTSGNPLVDSFLSCQELEPANGADHYTERLIRLTNFPTYYSRPMLDTALGRNHFGLDERQRVYLCTQNLRKFHPDFDPLLADILRSDPQGLLLIIGTHEPATDAQLLERFRRSMPDVFSRIRTMPHMRRDEYISLVAAANVILDTVHYGGGAQTVYDAAAVGTPYVALPGEFHRSLWAAAVNRKLNVPELIAATPRQYASIAIEVAQNPELRQALKTRILDAGAELFANVSTVADHDEYFEQAIAALRSESSTPRSNANVPAPRQVNWIFFDDSDLDYDVTTPQQRPLGGSQSALCYLATALAARGHRVTTLTGATSQRTVNGVRCLSVRSFPLDVFAPAHTVAVVLNGPVENAIKLRQMLPPGVKLVLWTQHAFDHTAMQRLRDPACAALWDKIVCVSQWQRTTFHSEFGTPPDRMTVLRNAIAPAFEGLFGDADDFATAKMPLAGPRLAYTSTPFRGLRQLLNCFPEIRRRHMNCRLEVYSSLQVYGIDASRDDQQGLYERCRITEGVDYRGSISQAELAKELRGAHILAYPNTWAETSCIAVLEALAAGAKVVTSDLGAIPETCGGWADLVPRITSRRPSDQFEADFVEAVAASLARLQSSPEALREQYEQVESINASCTWAIRAVEWEAIAGRLI